MPSNLLNLIDNLFPLLHHNRLWPASDQPELQKAVLSAASVVVLEAAEAIHLLSTQEFCHHQAVEVLVVLAIVEATPLKAEGAQLLKVAACPLKRQRQQRPYPPPNP
jgi:hypothetical protein